MLVVHISLTPLAGSPIRIVHALRRHTRVRAHLINLAPHAYGRRTFPEDLTWERDGVHARELIANADVLHFHHWFEFGSRDNPFGFDFLGACKPTARHLMQWHSSPAFTARNASVPIEQVVAARLPQLAMAQYHERYYPSARAVPLIVEHAHTIDVARVRNARPVVMFTPSQSVGAHVERWETKGKPEVVAVLERLRARGVLEPFLAQDLPFDECQRRRAAADIVIDDVVTGSFHTTTLESLSLGKPTVCWLDARTAAVLANLTQSRELPIVNAPFAALERVLVSLCADANLRAELGAFSRAWSLAHYAEATMIGHYERAYEELVATGHIAPERPIAHARARSWLAADLPDTIWAAGRRRFHPERLRVALKRSARALQRKLRSPRRSS